MARDPAQQAKSPRACRLRASGSESGERVVANWDSAVKGSRDDYGNDDRQRSDREIPVRRAKGDLSGEAGRTCERRYRGEAERSDRSIHDDKKADDGNCADETRGGAAKRKR
jgi:hypothetical protein